MQVPYRREIYNQFQKVFQLTLGTFSQSNRSQSRHHRRLDEGSMCTYRLHRKNRVRCSRLGSELGRAAKCLQIQLIRMLSRTFQSIMCLVVL